MSTLHQKTRDKISVLPLRFADSKYVQIAAYFPYECREEYGENNLVSYSQFPDEQGANMFYHNGRTANSINAINFSDTPTAIIIANFDMRTYDMKESRDFVSMHGVYYPLECLQAQWQMEELVRTYRPYVLILWDEAVNQLRTWFEVADNEIVVNGESIPYYLNTETMKYRNEIERLINMPYRGVTYKKVLTEEEASQLMNSNKQN